MQTHSTNDFRVAWNNHCDTHSFNSIPDPIPSATVSSQYFGSNFEEDSEHLYEAILADSSIQGSVRPPVGSDDMLTTVLTPSAWGY